MARGFFQKTFTYADTDAAGMPVIRPLDDLSVEVRLPGTVTKIQMYGSRNPTDLTPLANPIITGEDGLVEFWAEWADLDIFYHDNAAQPRVGDRTFGANVVSGADRGAPSIKVATDGNFDWDSFNSRTRRQDIPLGTVIDWWRPNATYDAGAGAGLAPPGFEVCDGATLTQPNHDFGAIGSIVLPDLRNKFIIGADIAKADAAAGTQTEGAAGAPGIRGASGSHTAQVPAHYHGRGTLAVATGGSHSHGVSGGHNVNPNAAAGDNAPAMGNAQNGAYYWGGVSGGTDVHAGHAHSTTGNVGATAGSNGDAAMAVENRPTHVGLLKIMKVRRA